MAMYDSNPLGVAFKFILAAQHFNSELRIWKFISAIGSCWGLEVEMFDRNERKWLRLDDFPNPGESFDISHNYKSNKWYNKSVRLPNQLYQISSLLYDIQVQQSYFMKRMQNSSWGCCWNYSGAWQKQKRHQ